MEQKPFADPWTCPVTETPPVVSIGNETIVPNIHRGKDSAVLLVLGAMGFYALGPFLVGLALFAISGSHEIFKISDIIVAFFLGVVAVSIGVPRRNIQHARLLREFMGRALIAPRQTAALAQSISLAVLALLVGLAALLCICLTVAMAFHPRARIFSAYPAFGIAPCIAVTYALGNALVSRSRIPKLKSLELPHQKPEGALQVGHLSDLHLTEGERTVEGQWSRNNLFHQFVVKNLPALRALPLLCVTGDLTDCGAPAEWKQFFETFPEDLRQKMVIVPGNHDINFPGPIDIYEDGYLVDRGLRLVRAMAAMDHVQGERASVLDKTGKLISLRDYLGQHGQELCRFLATPPIPTSRVINIPNVDIIEVDETPEEIKAQLSLPQQLWDGMFPLVIPLPHLGITAYVLDSNGSGASHALENAFGEIKQPQLDRLRVLLQREPLQASLVLLHHHIALPPNRTLWRRVQARFMTLLNADDFLRSLPQKRKVVVLHGHRHVCFFGEVIGSQVQVVSAPSTSFGDENSPQRHHDAGPGFFKLWLSIEPNCDLKITDYEFLQ